MILTLALGAALDRCDKPIHLGLYFPSQRMPTRVYCLQARMVREF